MTAALFTMQRRRDPSHVSGTGLVGTVVEFDSGLTVLHWDTATPSIEVHPDSRHILQLHGHDGATLLVPFETRLESSYRRVMPYLLEGHRRPIACAPHPDHPDRLRLVFAPGDETAWRRWIALFDGSTDDAVHEEVSGEMQHRWTSSDGDLWLQYTTPLTDDNEGPLTVFDREDR
jgi:hypothetical protein